MHLFAILLCLAHAVFGQWLAANYNNQTLLAFTSTNGTLINLFEDELFTGPNGFVEVLFFPNEGNGVTLQFKHRLLQIVEIPAGSQYTTSSKVLSTFTIAAWNGFGSVQNGEYVSTSNDPIGIYDVAVIPNLSSSFYNIPTNTTFDFQVPKSAPTSRIGFLTLAYAAETVNGKYVATSLSINDV